MMIPWPHQRFETARPGDVQRTETARTLVALSPPLVVFLRMQGAFAEMGPNMLKNAPSASQTDPLRDSVQLLRSTKMHGKLDHNCCKSAQVCASPPF